MDNSLEELENELARLTPRRPAARLVARLENDLGPGARTTVADLASPIANQRSSRWAGWALAGVAAAAALSLVVLVRRDAAPVAPTSAVPPMIAAVPPAAPVNRYEPVNATSVLYDLKEDGAAARSDATEGRQVRYRYVDTYTWRNSATDASLRWSVPREEVRVIPATLN